MRDRDWKDGRREDRDRLEGQEAGGRRTETLEGEQEMQDWLMM